jgi:hypothetical protein
MKTKIMMEKIVEQLDKKSSSGKWFEVLFCKTQMRREKVSERELFNVIESWSRENGFTFQKMPEYLLIILHKEDGTIEAIENNSYNYLQVIFLPIKN